MVTASEDKLATTGSETAPLLMGAVASLAIGLLLGIYRRRTRRS